MIQANFYIKFSDCDGDYRPIKWPIKYPYWCTGETNDTFIIIAYADNVEQILELWPEAYDIETEEVNEIKFSDRLRKPEWYND